MRIERLVLGALETNCYLVDDGEGGPLVVIDPAGDADRLIARVSGKDVAAIVLTHAHFDHLGAAAALVEATGAPLAVHDADAAAAVSAEGNGGAAFGFDYAAPPVSELLRDGDIVRAGGLGLRVLHTPGHTPGGISLYVPAAEAGAPDALGVPEPGHAFCGDTLFSGSVGRTDFAGGDARALTRSLREVLAALPDDTLVHPGHGPDTSIGREKRVNPWMARG
jgi:hydroxyacylglutathione hydrolase